MGLGVIVGACCIVRTVLNFQSIPLDSTYGGIDNWFWRLFEVQLGDRRCQCAGAEAGVQDRLRKVEQCCLWWHVEKKLVVGREAE